MAVTLITSLLVILVSDFALTTSTPYTPFYGVRCSKIELYSPNSLYQYSLYNILDSLTSKATNSGFYQGSYGETPLKAFAHYLCQGDLENQACSDCINAAKDTILNECPYRTKAFIYYDECMLRFSNESLFRKMETLPLISLYNVNSVIGNRTRFMGIVEDTMNRLAVEAATGGDLKKFATNITTITGNTTLYTAAQCTPDLTAHDCQRCLEDGIGHLLVSRGGRSLMPSCWVRYEVYPFFNTTYTPPPSMDSHPPPRIAVPTTSKPGKRKHASISHLAIIIPISIAITTFALGSGIWIFKRKKKILETSKFEINEIRAIESLEFELNTIRAATHNFSMDHKLGEGGFGEVYKGMLKEGQEVAIKRLSKNSSQGIEEFKTEVVLAAKLQHKNLVKLLGFCLASKEKILVYEFLQNSSLDHFLFDLTKKLSLDWKVRFKLIVGIARGLLYLHEDSRLKIIHRDLKPSNILLDEHMNPKISDFGLARLFGADQTQGDTKRIVGTYGYMAPEYAMTGHFSVKSDVYSFGIIVLEIISGQKNKFFGRPQQEEALLHRAWRLWNQSKGLDLVDTTLEKKYPKEEVLKCIHIGLFSIQENPVDRPTMATIVAPLNGQSISLPLPKPPKFFGNIATTSNNCSPSYNSLVGENGIDYHPQLDQQGFINVYTGYDEITTLYPR